MQEKKKKSINVRHLNQWSLGSSYWHTGFPLKTNCHVTRRIDNWKTEIENYVRNGNVKDGLKNMENMMSRGKSKSLNMTAKMKWNELKSCWDALLESKIPSRKRLQFFLEYINRNGILNETHFHVWVWHPVFIDNFFFFIANCVFWNLLVVERWDKKKLINLFLFGLRTQLTN